MKLKNGSTINLFYIPALILMLVFVAYPLGQAIYIAFTDWNGYSQHLNFVGFSNFFNMLKDGNLHTALLNTLIYGFGSAFFQNLFGLLLAVFLNSKFRGHSVVRTFVYLPVMIAGLIMGYIIYYFVQYDGGVFNEILGWLGQAPLDFMADRWRAVGIITFINVWQYTGISMVIYMAGLQSISTSYYEAATLDGANHWRCFWNITIPLIVPAMSTAVVMNLIGGLKLFDVIQSLTSGGPGFATHSLSTYISNQYFQAQNAGYSSAIGIITFVLIVVVAGVFNSFFSKHEIEA
ncbi:MAG: sugar ABC transporter permease [Bifidobacteriaceae bacterium]|nr:sugar ABC transporter permease [Bifidobacteriaceae bacterium]MCI1978641.1 sugar ABC transporter permease [Bifidobacteriaceae bacterium]